MKETYTLNALIVTGLHSRQTKLGYTPLASTYIQPLSAALPLLFLRHTHPASSRIKHQTQTITKKLTTMPDLTNHIQALPQELQDMICDRVVAIKPGQKIRIDKSYNAPWQLQVHPSDREKLAPIYFGESTFVTTFHWWPPHKTNRDIVNWAQLQTKAHREMIKHVEVEVKFGCDSDLPSDVEFFEKDARNRRFFGGVVRDMLKRSNVEFPNAEFSVTYGGSHDLWTDWAVWGYPSQSVGEASKLKSDNHIKLFHPSTNMSLDQRIQALAQELQDIIFGYTVAFEPGIVTINRKWKAPWQLQINRKSRAELSKAYYGHSTFRITTKAGFFLPHIDAMGQNDSGEAAQDDLESSC
ncbi:uncharacterized protein MYCFIDRAFT_78416 [Pseudocercospora fijiensis CIRAD86]|uniref:Uncharacterized protein n=1 Tax=Pseudocercospora fijiensis (strain CIRAD86) TaxID=383855 RepID=M2ZHZ2_PSEFD|nr:uncharacterized protein MYCFIDRAFT_78416 [Pseudocercospora fijiensis CIRAD86]EME78719.1 hypothetical protein MYCFIDRAFT_78416 [Pseudocercospora fijiensis CIRAD86]